MENVLPWCGQPSDRGRLNNRTEQNIVRHVVGKTAAFMVPTLERLLYCDTRSQPATRVLVLAPTRELAIQIYEESRRLAQFTHVSICLSAGTLCHQLSVAAQSLKFGSSHIFLGGNKKFVCSGYFSCFCRMLPHISFFLHFFLTYLFSCLSFPLRIDPLHFQAGCRKRRLNLTLVFLHLVCVAVHFY